MLIKIMEVIQEQETALLNKADARLGRDNSREARLDIVTAFNAIKGQVRASERQMIETVAAVALKTVTKQWNSIRKAAEEVIHALSN